MEKAQEPDGEEAPVALENQWPPNPSQAVHLSLFPA